MESTNQDMERILLLQKQYLIKHGPPSNKLRIDRLERLKSMIHDNRYKFADAMNEDFGVRGRETSLLSDIYTVIPALSKAIKELPKWTKKEKRKANSPFNLFGAKAYIQYEPLGTVGMISPWNFPAFLAFAPLAGVFSAGNQVMHKPSEHSPITSSLMKELCDDAFDETEFATFLGGPETGAAFTELQFDHLLYTGGGKVARHVMESAAKNLVPVTLELGGKSPVIIGESADAKTTAKRVMFGKTLNSGQICLAPDYVMVHKSKKDEFVNSVKEVVNEYYPSIKDNKDYTSIINQNHYDRIQGLIADAKEKGATVETINPANEDFSQQEAFKIPPTLVMNPTDDMAIMQEEIFGPVLVSTTFRTKSEAIEIANNTKYGLAATVWTENINLALDVAPKLAAGVVWVNATNLFDAAAGFGGVRESGFGREGGWEGLQAYSKATTSIKCPATIAAFTGFISVGNKPVLIADIAKRFTGPKASC